MAIEIPTTEPTEITAGDYIQWKIAEGSDTPIADGWVLSYAIVNAQNSIEVTCTDNGDNYHLATISVDDSSDFQSGDYKWQSYVTNGTARYKVDEGSLKILRNFADLDGGYDGRSHWKIVLDNVEAVIQGRATKDQSSYTVNGRQLSRTPVADLLMLYNKAKMNVVLEEKAEKQRKQMGGSNNILVRF